MKLLVDTNVWIDLKNAGILAEIAKSTFEWIVPDLLIDEIDEVVLPGCVHVRMSDSEELNEIIEVRRSRRALSNADAILFVAATAETCTLVTGDSALRTHAEAEDIEVHGVIWLLESFINQSVLSPDEAIDALEEMVSAGAQLPQEIVAKRILSWKIQK